jgi:mRNA-degrading endonuclease RelE of RelBE toxin-antitoxin system
LKSIEKQVVRRILDKILVLRNSPVIHDSKKIKNSNFFRVRVGKYRILYEVDYSFNLLGIVKIDKRSRVYLE